MASREEKLAQLREVCGIEEEGARQLLEATQWQLEEALALHFAGDAGPGAQTASSSSSAGASPSRTASAPQSESSLQEAATPAAPVPQDSGSWFGAVGSLLTRASQAFLGVASEDFHEWFVDRFGLPAPAFTKASFGDAVQLALSERRLLLAWFHQEENEATDRLCREVLQSDLVLDVLREHFAFWAGDITRFEPSQVARLLGLVKFPALVVLLPQQNSFSTNHFCVEWPLGTFSQPLQRLVPERAGEALDSDMVIAALATTGQDYRDETQVLEEERTRRNLQLAEDRRLREQQDREYEEGLLADQLAAVQEAESSQARDTAAKAEAEAAAKAEAEAAAKAEAAEAAARAESEREAARVEEEEEAQRQKRAAEILAQPEPVASADVSIARLRLQLPSGDRLQRTFRAEQTLAEVYEWAHCCRPKPKPMKFELCISFPVRILRDRSATLKELDLAPSAALVLREADD